DGKSARSNRGEPIIKGLLHTFFFLQFSQYSAIIIDSITDDRPAKVGSFFYHVDLITTSWTMLMHPDLARFGMPDHTLRVSMAIGVNGFFRIGLIYKRIVGR